MTGFFKMDITILGRGLKPLQSRRANEYAQAKMTTPVDLQRADNLLEASTTTA
jgi:hypothetical protein